MSSDQFDYSRLSAMESAAYNTMTELDHTNTIVDTIVSRVSEIECLNRSWDFQFEEIESLKAEIAELRLIIQSIKPYIPVIEGIEDII